jgi:hypothetical protein
MKPAGTRRIRCAASSVHSNVDTNGLFLSSRATRRVSPAAAVTGTSGARPAISSGAPVSSSITCRAKSSVIASSFIMRARFSTRALTRRR